MQHDFSLSAHTLLQQNRVKMLAHEYIHATSCMSTYMQLFALPCLHVILAAYLIFLVYAHCH
jgi:hypothetical protein